MARPQLGQRGVPEALQFGRPVVWQEGQKNWPPAGLRAAATAAVHGAAGAPIESTAIRALQYGHSGAPTLPQWGQ